MEVLRRIIGSLLGKLMVRPKDMSSNLSSLEIFETIIAGKCHKCDYEQKPKEGEVPIVARGKGLLNNVEYVKCESCGIKFFKSPSLKVLR